MEGDAVSATIGVLVQNLINVSKDEISLIRGLQENAEELRITFSTIRSYLNDAQTRSITEEAVKTWLKNLEAKAFDADNAFDELNYQLLSKRVASRFPSFNHYVRRRDLAIRIKKINTSFESINKRATELGLQGILAVAPVATRGAVSETDSFTVDPIFIGRDSDVSKIVEMLTAPTEEVVSILPIVGMGGLGKTTLVRNVFNHVKTKTRFGQHIWVHVSQNFDALILLKKIFKTLHGRNVEDESREDLLKKIQEALIAKTYLLVLDDVWNEDQQKWEDFIRSWSGITSTKGNGIIVTTRNAGVGSLVKTVDMHLLSGLSKEQCWSIIKDRAFEGGPILPDLEDIGTSIAERCKGLPLAANVVGGVLRGKSRDEWHSIKENWLSDVGGDENYISRILKLSFHHLSSQALKKCFAYCSIFPKGAQINTDQLIALWMAEGFLQPSQISDLETVGSQFLKVLVRNSLLQVVDKDEYDEVKHCTIHDLVHDVAGSILNDIYYKRDESRRIPNEQAKWHICWGCNGGESSPIPKVQEKWLRTLIYNGRIYDFVFSDFKSLHSLTLMDDNVKKLPASIRELIHLRYLDISDTSIRYLPNSIGKLSHLQTIRAYRNRGSGLKKLPSTLKHLFNLRHLYMDHYTEMPPQLGKIISLRTLPCFKVRNNDCYRIEELGSLKNLKGELKIYTLENVQDEEESKKAYLFQKPGVVRLVLMWSWNRQGERINDENVLKGLQPHPNIKMLKIYGYRGATFPSWTLKMEGLTNLMEIILEACEECEEIPMLGHLPHLKSLCLRYLKKVKFIGPLFYNIKECNSSVFPALQRLELSGMWNLTEWEELKVPSSVQVEVFPYLEYLKIWECTELTSAPSQFTSLKELDISAMDSELPLANICGIKLKTLTKLDIEQIGGLISLPDWLFHNNQQLSVLNISDCPKLRELPDGLHCLNSLEELYFGVCPNFKTIPHSVSGGKLQGLTSLRRLSISRCRVLTCFLGEMEESCAPSLEYLKICADDDSDAWDCASFKKVVDGILRFGSHSLRVLDLRGRQDWECLPDQIQHLTALSELVLFSFGIEELPEWLGNLSSLQELQVSKCKKLKHLPSVEVMRRLTKLDQLYIDECPLLLERCTGQQSDDDGFKLPRISHKPKVLW